MREGSRDRAARARRRQRHERVGRRRRPDRPSASAARGWSRSARATSTGWSARSSRAVDSTIGFTDAQGKAVYDLTPRQQLQLAMLAGRTVYDDPCCATDQRNCRRDVDEHAHVYRLALDVFRGILHTARFARHEPFRRHRRASVRISPMGRLRRGRPQRVAAPIYRALARRRRTVAERTSVQAKRSALCPSSESVHADQSCATRHRRLERRGQ